MYALKYGMEKFRDYLQLCPDVTLHTDHLNIVASKGECRWVRFADELEVVRPHALGRFRDLIRASATSPAMLIYLDGHDNKVVHPEDKPNENYARELLELHTLGVDGGYTQRDVFEAARCLSGWTYGHEFWRGRVSRVAFDPTRHDRGEKEVLGVRSPAGGGEQDLERLLDIVCVHPGGPRVIGPAAIRASFEAIFANGAIPVVPEQVHRLHTIGSAVHHLAERITVQTSEGARTAWVLATNVYVKTAQGWRLVALHASPGSLDEKPPEQGEVPATLH
jgi:ketosteroid isomerase-like protein